MDEFFLDFWGGFETSRTQISRTNFFNDLVPVRDGGTRWHLSAEHYRLVRDGWHSTFYMNASSRVQKKFCLVNKKMLCCQSVRHKNRQRKVLKQKKSRGSEKGSNNERTEAWTFTMMVSKDHLQSVRYKICFACALPTWENKTKKGIWIKRQVNQTHK